MKWEDTSCIVSKSLIKVHKEVIEREQDFCLGLIGWCPCSECTPRMETTREKNLKGMVMAKNAPSWHIIGFFYALHTYFVINKLIKLYN